MYNERKENFSVKDIILQISFVVLFIFLLVWLFPTKQYIDDSIKDINVEINGQSFAENMNTMKDAAISYFTTPRLPAKVGDKVKITLGEMIDKKLVLELVSEDGKACDKTKSYVEVTKMNDEYVMKINLNCGDKSDYILVHLGCYNYCETTLCEKKEVVVEKPVTPTKPVTPVKPIVVNYQYEYKLTTSGYYTNWSTFSAWSTTAQTTDNLKNVETKIEKEVDHYDTVTVQTGTKTTQVVDYYKDVQVQTGTIQVGTGTYTRGAWITRTESKYPLSPTATRDYVYFSTRKELDCTSSCKYVNIYVYDVYYRSEVMTTQPVYTTVKEPVYKTVTTPVYEEQQKAVYKNVTYYRYQTRTYVPGTVVIKWSNTKTDTSLTSQGYVLTGNSRKA